MSDKAASDVPSKTGGGKKAAKGSAPASEVPSKKAAGGAGKSDVPSKDVPSKSAPAAASSSSAVAPVKKAPKPVKKSKVILDLGVAVVDKLLKLSDVKTFLTSNIKVDGKAGAIAGKVEVEEHGNTIVVKSTVHYAKRYFKYLLKKYLKVEGLRDFLRVIAGPKEKSAKDDKEKKPSSDTYVLRYFKTNAGAAEDEE